MNISHYIATGVIAIAMAAREPRSDFSKSLLGCTNVYE